MQLTKLDILLADALKKSSLTVPDQQSVFLFLKTPEDQKMMIYFLRTNPCADEQTILGALKRILLLGR